jgi:hypothetical protein
MTMQITFDPHNPEECATIARLLGTTAPAETARADGLTVTDGPTPPFEPSQMTPLAEGAPQYIKGEVTPAQPDTEQPETDCHGMVHDDTIHSTPASKNADGSWRAKRGQKEAYEAAIAAATQCPAESAPTPAPAPQGMPVPQPASAAPATPPAPIDYNTMAERFMAKMADPDGLPAEYEAIYTALSIGYDDLETNQTSIARLWNYMDSVDEGNDHDECVRHAMSA